MVGSRSRFEPMANLGPGVDLNQWLGPGVDLKQWLGPGVDLNQWLGSGVDWAPNSICHRSLQSGG